MKVIICDNCGCTDKSIGFAQIAVKGETLLTTDVVGEDFEEINGFDFCNDCVIKLKNAQNELFKFFTLYMYP